jgi:hypothetical protein
MPTDMQNLDRVYLEHNPNDQSFTIAVDGDLSGIAVTLAKAMRTNEIFERAVKLAFVIRGMP